MTSSPASSAATSDWILHRSLSEQASMLANGDLSSSELTELSLGRIAATQSTLNCFRVICERSAREQARAADMRLAAGERLALLGVPVAIKDDIDLDGEATSFGCAGRFPAKTADSEVVGRLRAAGAVIVGKTNTPEIGLYPFTEGLAFGATRNPWSLEHTPGGSSGGAAAAVAGGIVAGAIGSDGAGSVRIPAAWTGLVGLKPQRGRISTWPHPEAFNGLTCLGPLTRTVADCALLLDLCSGGHRGDLHVPAPAREPFAKAAARDPGSLRIALSLKAPFSAAPVTLDSEIRAATVRLASVLSGLGHRVSEADPSYGVLAGLTLIIRGQSGVHQWTASEVTDCGSLDARTRSAANVGKLLGGPPLRLARASESWLRRRIGSIFKDVDVVLTPCTAKPPLRIGVTDGLGGWATDQIMAGACPYAWPWNVLGWPGLSVPAGSTQAGLPIGVQLLGGADSEAMLLSLAAQLEAVEQWPQRLAPLAIQADQAD